ncbi:MAG TPA: VIT domain-containing protein [Ignavibacteriales bacterium]|nr:VIT domain-containing protein [Ignavibacteriales bacterium]
MPVKKEYPKDFLRLKSTEVTVNIHGIVAETIVLQSFENEWDDSTDAVYSFPLPPDARATNFVYWYQGKPYRAVLQVKEQSTNPGTGEGGAAALVNSYIGRNGIKIYLKGIKAHSIQTVRLHYVSLLDYYQGKSTYTFPLNTKDFVPYPLDYAKFYVNVNSNTPITKFDIPGYTDIKTSQPSDKELAVEILKSKFYLDNNFSFSYETDISKLGVDFYSIGARDTTGGHFAVFVRPQNKALADSVLKKCIVFLLSKNSNMSGTRLDASKSAISKSLDLLSPKDYFNIVTYDYYVNAWKSSPVQASSDNISGAKSYLNSITTSGGSNLQEALKQSLSQFNDSAFVNNTFNRSVLVFSEGGSNLDPVQIEKLNTKKAGIFPICLADNIAQARLEMAAALNYGFVTYIGSEDNAEMKMLRIFSQISQPILKDAAFEFGSHAGISGIVPERIPVTFAGSSFFMAGRYKSSGDSPLSIAGYSVKGVTAFDFRLPFSADTLKYRFAESIWAKERIDELERKIEIYGETPSSKQELIALSLKYNIRCRYTAYIADYKTPATDVKAKKNAIVPQSFIAGNYPNPFNPSTKIRLFLSDASRGKLKFVRIYNVLGQLVALIDITGFNAGWNEVYFNGRDLYGSTLPSGIYFVRLQVGEEFVSTFRINLIK